jgi:hypothetical protein
MMRAVIFMSLIATAVLAAPLTLKDQAETPRLLSEPGGPAWLQNLLANVFAQLSGILDQVFAILPFLQNFLSTLFGLGGTR